MRNLAFIPGIVAIAACAPASRDTVRTAPSSASWEEFRSTHFVIDVARRDRDPARLVGTFEELHAAVLAALVSEPVEISGRVRVVVLSSRRELRQFTGADDVVGLFWVSRLGEPTILLAAEDLDDIPQIIAHELTHYLSRYLFPQQPFWFAEGLAQFVEGVAKRDGDGRRWAGADPTDGWVAGAIKLTPVEDLVTRTFIGWFDDPYLTSWILYRFLWNERSSQLSRYQRALSEGQAPDDAWRSAFPEWNIATGTIRLLNNDLVQHQRSGRGLRWEVKVPEVDRTFTAAAGSAASVQMVLLEPRLRTTNRLLTPRVRRETAELVLREDPTNPEATAELAAVAGTPLLPQLRAVAAARPNDGRAWFLLGREETDPARREAALRHAVEHWPDGALAHAALAFQLASTGRAREGLPIANRAVDLAPWSADAVAALAKVALELGKCAEAVLLQSRAVEISHAHGVGSVGSDVKELGVQLASYRQRCTPSTGTSPPAASSAAR